MGSGPELPPEHLEEQLQEWPNDRPFDLKVK